jgi:hypothetical protein
MFGMEDYYYHVWTLHLDDAHNNKKLQAGTWIGQRASDYMKIGMYEQ